MSLFTVKKSPQASSVKLYIVGLLLSFCALTTMAVFSVWSINKQSELVELLYKHPFTVSTNVLEANAHLVAMHRYMKDVVIAREPIALAKAIQLVSEHETQVLNHLKTAKKEFLGNKERFQQVIDAVIAWREIRSEVIELSMLEQHKAAADITINKGADYVRLLNSEMTGLVEFAKAKAAEFLLESRQQRARNQTIQLIVFIGILVIGLSVYSIMFRLIRDSEKSIRASEYRYRSIYNNLPLSIWDEDYSSVFKSLESLRKNGVTDLKAYLNEHPDLPVTLANSIKVIQVNRTSLEMFSAEDESQLIGSIASTFTEGTMTVFIDSLLAMWNKEELFVAKTHYKRLDGKLMLAEIAIPLPSNLSESRFVPVVIEDITQNEKSEAQLRLFASVFTEANEGICIVSPETEIVEVNQAFCDITGYTREEVIGKNPRILQSGRHEPEFYHQMWKAMADSGAWRGEIWNQRKDGSVYPQFLTMSKVTKSNGELVNYIGLFSDISKLKAHEEELRHLAQYDALTGLPNRMLFAEQLKHAMASSKRTNKSIAVVYIDLDGFKAVNDSFGHKMGDQLLGGVANRMSSSIREVDSLSRVGGDEFVAILSDISDLDTLKQLLNRILEHISHPYCIEGVELVVSASMGVAIYSAEEELDGDQLQRQADQAMYDAKLAGRNTFRFYDPKHNNAISKKYELLAEVERAIAENEFELYYQPKSNLRTGEIIGVEALIRWNHPQKGLLMPGSFLPEIENELISVKVGRWVIEAALQQLYNWQINDINIPISVNVSPIQLQQPDFIAGLSEQLAAYPAVPNDLLELEILETSSLKDFDLAAEVVKEGKKLGVKFALDDFGSGYSSLVYLKKLPVDTLKIDQEFVRTMLKNRDDETILIGVLGLASNFNMVAIAEGVETSEHIQTLLCLGCEYGQGYAISEPLPIIKLEQFLQSWQQEAVSFVALSV